MVPGQGTHRPTDTATESRDQGIVDRGTDRWRAVMTLVRHHQGSREAITTGRALALGLAVPPDVVGAVLVGSVVSQ
jgi:hypothetical protein